MAVMTYIEGGMMPRQPISIKYQWLVEKLKKEFPEPMFRVVTKVGNYGAGFAVAVLAGSKRAAYIIEDVVSFGGIDQLMHEDEYDESSPIVMRKGPPYETKTIGLPNSNDPNGDVDKMIKEIWVKLSNA